MKFILYFILIPALLPVFLILRYVYLLDKNEREPLNFVLKVVIYGAFFSIPCAAAERFLISMISMYYDPATIQIAWMENTVGVALVEEFSKWLVLMLIVWKNRNFDYRYDGIVYAVSASLGFAALENILYVVSYGTGVSIGRAIFAIPGHATFGVFMGYWLSRAKTFWLDGKTGRMKFCKLLALGIPMLIHGAYDFLLSEQVAALGYQYVFYIYVILLDFFAWRIIKHEFRTDRPL
ncbi:Membrane proteinase PrsW, cleaves anti-sigma factor RsiW, M82 family [Treponema bryantii]|uniref:Protease PrsW n=1 Tax=Treponema bryantii TaxID=163 RepID=A0A1H9A4Q0_9SPIR|nr:PrsW family glutamic-type intramembrane protease [Treponema bryantii]SEP71511.1 Membrane proteinase PrsW, cleaves anti-sigma factor RsiW, M82 family [Treponema bryantii]